MAPPEAPRVEPGRAVPNLRDFISLRCAAAGRTVALVILTMKRYLAALALPLLAIACSSTGEPTDTSSDAVTTCATAYDAVQADRSGQTLARAREIHTPSDAEIKATAFFFAVAVDAYGKGAIDEDLAHRIIEASGDPAQAPLFGATVTQSYAELAPPCSIGTTSSPLISSPYECTDDCRLGVADLAKYFGLTDAILQGLAKKIGGDLGEILASAHLNARQGQTPNTLSDAIGANVNGGRALNVAVAAGEALANGVATTGTVSAMTGAEPVAAGADATVAVIYLPVISAKILSLANLVNGCRKFLATQCGKVQGKSTYSVAQHYTADDESGHVSLSITTDFQITPQPTPGEPGVGLITGTGKLTLEHSGENHDHKCSRSMHTPTQHFDVPLKGTYHRNPDGSIEIEVSQAKATATLYPASMTAWSMTETCSGRAGMNLTFPAAYVMIPCKGTLKNGVFKGKTVDLFKPQPVNAPGWTTDSFVDTCDLTASDTVFP